MSLFHFQVFVYRSVTLQDGLQYQIRGKSKEMMRKAYLAVRAKIRETHKSDEGLRAGAASVMVVNREKLVTANMGDFRVVVCRDGEAHQMKSRRRETAKRHWSRRLFSGMEHSLLQSFYNWS